MINDTTKLISSLYSYIDNLASLDVQGRVKEIHKQDILSCEFSLRELINEIEYEDSFLSEEDIEKGLDEIIF